MVRRILFEVLLFLLPFALYLLYLRMSANDEKATPRAHPWTTLFISGLVLVAASFIIWGVTEGAGEKGTYVPPHVVNGQVVPGRVDPAK
jgi:heme/copper-type cytochrome/quinol oxidase subunit 3